MAISIARYGTERTANGSFVITHRDVSYEGCVLRLGEINGYDDSDFYAVVWDAASGSTKTITYATTRGYTYDNHASVDATPETWAAFFAHYVAGFRFFSANRAWKQATTVERGKQVRVTRGRKVKPGTEGRIFWQRDGRSGLELADGSRVFTNTEYLVLVDPFEDFDYDFRHQEEDDRRAAERAFRDTYGDAALAAATSVAAAA